MKRLPVAAVLPSLLLSAVLVAATQPENAADRGPTIQMTVTPASR